MAAIAKSAKEGRQNTSRVPPISVWIRAKAAATRQAANVSVTRIKADDFSTIDMISLSLTAKVATVQKTLPHHFLQR